MAETKTIQEWEKEDNNLINDADINSDQTVTRSEFDDLKEDKGYVGVDFDARTSFLEKNGYNLTRKNYLDLTLTDKTEKESK